jgi:hypothetical protein
MTTQKVTPPLVIDERQRYSIAEACAILRFGPAHVYREIKDGRLNVIREGRRTYVHGTELIRRSSVPS